MERLDVAVRPENPNIEAAIHFARYAISKEIVAGKRVLDMACGEGYGTYLLKKAGADAVVGVDISSETVERARNRFGIDGVTFHCADAASICDLFEAGSFDVIISIETIEHLAYPEKFLQDLKKLARLDGVIVLSCPNDHWYYPEKGRSNPYHLRKYRFEEFQAVCRQVLGANVQWSLGTGVFGFGSTPIAGSDGYSVLPDSWMSYADVGGGYLVSGEAEIAATAEQSSYFIGVWNAKQCSAGIAVFPLSMDQYARLASATDVIGERDRLVERLQAEQEQVIALRAEADRVVARADADAAKVQGYEHELATAETTRRAIDKVLRGALVDVSAARDLDTVSIAALVVDALAVARVEQRRLGLRFNAVQAEGQALRDTVLAQRSELHRLQSELDRHQSDPHVDETLLAEYRIGYERYIRLREIIPQRVRSRIVRAVKALRAQGKK